MHELYLLHIQNTRAETRCKLFCNSTRKNTGYMASAESGKKVVLRRTELNSLCNATQEPLIHSVTIRMVLKVL
jgi:hypothetical protein